MNRMFPQVDRLYHTLPRFSLPRSQNYRKSAAQVFGPLGFATIFKKMCAALGFL